MDWAMILAVVPGLIVLFYVYKKDKVEKEPGKLLVKLLIFGALSVIPAIIFEVVGEAILDSPLTDGMNSLVLVAIDNFLIIALAEELCKYMFLKWGSWKHPAFDYRFDALVYAVCVGMGFAITENIFYVIQDGLAVAAFRAVTSIPGHACFAISMGIYYGEAKLMEKMGFHPGSKAFRRKALWVPVLMHGFYDFSLSIDAWWMIAIFFIYIIATDIVIIRKIRKYSREDAPLDSDLEEEKEEAVKAVEVAEKAVTAAEKSNGAE